MLRAAILSILFLSPSPSRRAARQRGRPRRPRSGGRLDRGGQGRVRDRDESPQPHLADARRRPAHRGVLPRTWARRRCATCSSSCPTGAPSRSASRTRPSSACACSTRAASPTGRSTPTATGSTASSRPTRPTRPGSSVLVHVEFRALTTAPAQPVRPARPGALEQRRRRLGRLACRRPRGLGLVGCERAPHGRALQAHLERLPRHERRLDRPGRRPPHEPPPRARA